MSIIAQWPHSHIEDPKNPLGVPGDSRARIIPREPTEGSRSRIPSKYLVMPKRARISFPRKATPTSRCGPLGVSLGLSFSCFHLQYTPFPSPLSMGSPIGPHEYASPTPMRHHHPFPLPNNTLEKILNQKNKNQSVLQ